MKLNEKKSALEILLQQKVNQLQQIEGTRQQLASDVVSLRGQLKLLEELIIESKGSEEKNGDDKSTTKSES